MVVWHQITLLQPHTLVLNTQMKKRELLGTRQLGIHRDSKQDLVYSWLYKKFYLTLNSNRIWTRQQIQRGHRYRIININRTMMITKRLNKNCIWNREIYPIGFGPSELRSSWRIIQSKKVLVQRNNSLIANLTFLTPFINK